MPIGKLDTDMESTHLVEEILEIALSLDRGDITIDEAKKQAEILVTDNKYLNDFLIEFASYWNKKPNNLINDAHIYHFLKSKE